MDISARLAADLVLLSQALDRADGDLEAALGTLAATVAHAVSSYRGLTVTMALPGHEVSFTVRDGDDPVCAASLRIPFAAITSVDGGSSLVLYAANPGAFVDLAADLSHALGADGFALDAHLTPPPGSTELTGLDGHMAVNRAIGILIDRGHTPESASQEIRRIATSNSQSLHAAAITVVRGVADG